MNRTNLAALLAAGALFVNGAQAQKNPPRPRPPKPNQGERALGKLARMSPSERERALSSVPPPKRKEILQKFEKFQTMAPPDKQRVASELERWRSLPPQRQKQVRQSLQALQALPDDRRQAVQAELQRLGSMPEDARPGRISSREFRTQYSPAEQQMISTVADILPDR